jgi:DNA invertase Pin-like site-specific DNA recombinase
VPSPSKKAGYIAASVASRIGVPVVVLSAAAVAEFERDLLIEPTQAGLSRAKAAGKALGRPQTLSNDQ